MKSPFPPLHFHLRSRLWLVLAGSLLVLQLLWPNRAWTIMLTILGGAWLVSFFWARSLAYSLGLEREMRYGWAHVGDQLEQRFTATNSGWAPGIWLEVEDRSDLPDYLANRVTSIGRYSMNRWKVEGTCKRRGLYTLGPTILRSGDPLGFYQVELHQSETAVLLVLPPVLPLPSIEIAAGGQVGESRRTRRSALETTVSVDTVREYIPGDSQKSIHWPTSARRGSLYVRQFEHNPSSDWWIFLDLEAAVQVGQGSRSTEEHGVILAASLADRGLRQGRAVGVVAAGKELLWIPPRHSPGQLMEILRALALVTSGQHSLADLLRSSQRSLQRGASLVLITPDVRGRWTEPLLRLSESEVTPTVLLLDPTSFGGEGSSAPSAALLENLGIAHTIIRSDLLDQPDIHPESQERWEWRITGSGRAVPVRRPKDMSWRRLG